MKKIVFILLVVFVVSGCDYTRDLYFLYKIGDGYDLYYHNDFEDLDSFEEIAVWIDSNVEYHHTAYDEWQSPKITVNLGKGDCEDAAILFVNIAYVSMGIKCGLAIFDSSRSIKNGGYVDHAEVYYNGEVYNAGDGEILNNIKIGYIYKFKELFK